MRKVNIFVKTSAGKIFRSIGPIPNDDRALVKVREIEAEYANTDYTIVMRYAKQYEV